MERASNDPIVLTVYYRQSNWHTLLQFIHPHLKRYVERNLLDWYCIELGSQQGDYVRLIICSSDNRENSARLFSEKIKHYIEDHPSDDVEVAYPLNSYFMDYPNNSVWIDHNRSFKFVYAYQDLSGVHMQISRILITASGSEQITFESMCTVFVYLQLGMIRAFCPDIGQAATMVNTLTPERPVFLQSTEKVEQMDIVDSLFEQLFNENLAILVGMVNDVWKRGGSENAPPWIADWENVVKNFVGDSDIHSAVSKLSSLVYKHMTFIDNTRLPMLSLRLISGVLAIMTTRSGGTFASLDS